MPYIARVAGKRAKLNVFGDDYPTPDGTGVRDYIHVVDLARGHVAACAYLATHTGCEAINLGTGKGQSVLELVHTFEQVNGVPIPYEVVARRAGDIATSRKSMRPKQRNCWAGRRKKRWKTCAAIPGAGKRTPP